LKNRRKLGYVQDRFEKDAGRKKLRIHRPLATNHENIVINHVSVRIEMSAKSEVLVRFSKGTTAIVNDPEKQTARIDECNEDGTFKIVGWYVV